MLKQVQYDAIHELPMLVEAQKNPQNLNLADIKKALNFEGFCGNTSTTVYVFISSYDRCQ